MYNTQVATKNQVNNLLQEIRTLRSVVIGWIGKHTEGSYNPHFVKRVLKASKDKPIANFKDKATFLRMLKD